MKNINHMTYLSDEAFAIMAVCPETNKSYGITVDYLSANKFKFVWAFVSRTQFSNPKRFAPLVDIFNWNHISNIRLVSGGTHIESTPAEIFRTQINKKRELLVL